MSRLIDLTGKRFGRLTVQNRGPDYISRTGRADPQWNCVCDCGNVVVVRGCHLRNGHTQSCGCWQVTQAANAQKKYNDFRIVGEKVYVKLSNSDKEMITDLDIWEAGACRYCWGIQPSGYVSACIDSRKVTRRFHVYAFPDCPEGMVRDHIDGNRLNNCRENIRFVTVQQNTHNHGIGKRNTSAVTGVSWNSQRMKWKAQIHVNGKHINLGNYSDVQDAIDARKAAEIKYFGEYRRK